MRSRTFFRNQLNGRRQNNRFPICRLGGGILTFVGWIAFSATAVGQELKPAPQGWPTALHEIRYAATVDDSRQPALIYVARAKSKRPLLVGLHTWSGDYKQTANEVDYADWAIKHDWHFIHPDFRGPNWKPDACGSPKAVQDILDAVKHMKSSYSVDPDRVYLVGVSGGGHAALLMAGHAPDVWAGVSAWVPIADIQVWWKQKDGNASYARHIEKAVGGRPDVKKSAARECKRRSPITYLGQAGGVNLDINAGVHDGHDGGSVPFSHSLYAFNAVVPKTARLPSDFIEQFYRNQALPRDSKTAADPAYGKKQVVFRKIHANARVTIFDGGHEIIHQAALAWLSAQRRGQMAKWKIDPVTDSAKKPR